MRSICRAVFAATFVVALFMSSATGATTLADLTEPDARLVIGGVVYENFAVKIKGKEEISQVASISAKNDPDIGDVPPIRASSRA